MDITMRIALIVLCHFCWCLSKSGKDYVDYPDSIHKFSGWLTHCREERFFRDASLTVLHCARNVTTFYRNLYRCPSPRYLYMPGESHVTTILLTVRDECSITIEPPWINPILCAKSHDGQTTVLGTVPLTSNDHPGTLFRCWSWLQDCIVQCFTWEIVVGPARRRTIPSPWWVNLYFHSAHVYRYDNALIDQF
jgi:hypothetical protein